MTHIPDDEQLPLAGSQPDPSRDEHEQGHCFLDADESPLPSAPSPPPSAAEGEDGTLIMVDPADIDPSPALGRRTHDSEEHHALTESIRAEGRILTPVTGMRMPDGRIQIKDGHARVDAAREIGILVPVYLWTTDPVTAMVEAIRANDLHAGGTAYAKGCRYRALQALITRLEGADQASTRKLGLRIGVGHTVISEHVSIAEMLTVELAERAEVDFGAAAALDKTRLLRISRLPSMDAQSRALCRLIHGRAPSWSVSTHAAPQDVRARSAYRIREHRNGTCSVTYDPAAMTESQASRMVKQIREQLRAARDAQGDDAAAA